MKFLSRIKQQRDMVLLYKKVFSSPEGQRVLADMMSVCGINTLSFDVDPLKMSFNEGKKEVILRILKTINVTEKELERWFKNQQKEIEEMNMEEQYE